MSYLNIGKFNFNTEKVYQVDQFKAEMKSSSFVYSFLIGQKVNYFDSLPIMELLRYFDFLFISFLSLNLSNDVLTCLESILRVWDLSRSAF